MMIIFVNVGKTSNLARSLLLYIQKNRFCRKFASRFLHNSPNGRAIREMRLSANSVNFCKFAEFLQNPQTLLQLDTANNLANSTKHGTETGQQNALLLSRKFSKLLERKKLIDSFALIGVILWYKRMCGRCHANELKSPAKKDSGETSVDISPASIIDYALLRPDVTKSDLERACREALEYNIHSVFVNPCWVDLCAEILGGSSTLVGSVSGFPLGATCRRVKALEAERVIADGAGEVDMVINIGALKSRELELVEEDIRSVRNVCPENIVLKVIIECCLLTDEEKGLACEIAERAGADFVKTSTGMSNGGATVKDVHLLRGACPRRMGVKAAGGINTLDDVVSMCKAGASRIGTSHAVSIINEWNVQKGAA